jgi:hypothetical protein
VPDELGVDLVLAGGRPRPAGLADVDELGVGPAVPQDVRVHEPVDEHDVGLGQQLGAAQGQQPRVTRPGADERHRPRPHPAPARAAGSSSTASAGQTSTHSPQEVHRSSRTRRGRRRRSRARGRSAGRRRRPVQSA